MEELISFLGKLHPVILHLPIGFLFLAFMMEVHSRWKKNTTFNSAITFSLFWGMIGSIVAAGSGYLLSLNGGYEEDLLSNHKWLGIGVAIVSVILYFLNKSHQNRGGQLYLPVFSLIILGVILTGHFGGSLTHGSDFLLSNAKSKNTVNQIVDIENAVLYADIIQPILKEKCVRCHNDSKKKGDLLMTTIEGMQQGGKSGELIVNGDIKKSLLLKRIHLPIKEKEHMPPKGKSQLIDDEIELLEWWIQEGADFESTVGLTKTTDKIDEILKKYIVPVDGLASANVKPVKESTLVKIRSKGIPIYRVGPESSFVEVDLSRRTDITSKTIKTLRPVKDQLILLNLANTTVTDKDLSAVRQFTHLQKLQLQQTDITDKGVQHLENLDFLEHVNLYGTKVSDESISILSQLKRLKKVFLWQTNVSDGGIAQFQKEKPKAIINTGVDTSIFGDARLKAPLIVAEKDLFRDSLLVELKTNFKDVNIFFTTDGTDPDTTKKRYMEPIVLRKSAIIKVIAQKENWTTSDVASRQFARVGHTPKNIVLSKSPHERYKANGKKSLIDLEKGSLTFSDGQWLGYENEHLTATLDFGKPVAVSSVTVGALEAPGSYIFYPKGISISLSETGNSYKDVLSKTYTTATENAPTKLASFTEGFEKQEARFVKVEIKSNLVNPDWHPAPGAPCWLFIDEISVE